MAIITAGVVMNLILGFVCFAYIFGQEREVTAAKVGSVVPGSPAFAAGLRPGDEIVAIDGHRDVGFKDLMVAVNLSGSGQVIEFGVKRPGEERELTLPIEPRREANSDRPTIGVRPALSLDVGDDQPTAGATEPIALPWPDDRRAEILVVTAAAPAGETPTPLSSHEDFRRLSTRHRDKALDLVLLPRTFAGKPVPGLDEPLKATAPPSRFVDYGLRFAPGPITAIRKGSPADAAGFKLGDVIVGVEGREDLDPLTLPLDCFDRAGSPTKFQVHREGSAEPVELTATPDDSPPNQPLPMEDLEIPGLGLYMAVPPTVVSVVSDSPAEKAGIKPGDVIDAVTIPPVKGRARENDPSREFWLLSRPQTFTFSDKSSTWPSALDFIQTLPIQDVSFKLHDRDELVSIRPEPVADRYAAERGLRFLEAHKTMPPLGPVDALKEGLNETVESVGMMYASLRSLATGRVSSKQLAGPIGIGPMAYAAAKAGINEFLYFLAFISINLAVLNFLPIPPLDGGQMMFLIAEKVRGRPLPESAMIAGTYFGLLLVLSLMVFATYQDVYRLLSGYFF
jgi:regulator of sigma E protease